MATTLYDNCPYGELSVNSLVPSSAHHSPHPRPGATPDLAVRPLVYILAPAVTVTAASIWCIVTSLRLTSPLPSGWCSSGSCRRYICTCLRRRGRLSTGRRLPREVLGLLCYSWASGSDGMTTPTCWVRLVDWGAQARRGWRASTDPPASHSLPQHMLHFTANTFITVCF